MRSSDRFARCALLVCQAITVTHSASELSLLTEALEAHAVRAADDPHPCDYADYVFRRVAELRDAGP